MHVTEVGTRMDTLRHNAQRHMCYRYELIGSEMPHCWGNRADEGRKKWFFLTDRNLLYKFLRKYEFRTLFIYQSFCLPGQSLA